jgi:hypothetical protein
MPSLTFSIPRGRLLEKREPLHDADQRTCVGNAGSSSGVAAANRLTEFDVRVHVRRRIENRTDKHLADDVGRHSFAYPFSRRPMRDLPDPRDSLSALQDSLGDAKSLFRLIR